MGQLMMVVGGLAALGSSHGAWARSKLLWSGICGSMLVL
jgi:hypothetical protein